LSLDLIIEESEAELVSTRSKRLIESHLVDESVDADDGVDLPAQVHAVKLDANVLAASDTADAELQQVAVVGARRGKGLAPAAGRVEQGPRVSLDGHVGALDLGLAGGVGVPLCPGDRGRGASRVDAAVDLASLLTIRTTPRMLSRFIYIVFLTNVDDRVSELVSQYSRSIGRRRGDNAISWSVLLNCTGSILSRKCTTKASVEGVVAEKNRVVAVGRLACSAGNLGLVVVDASQLGAVTVESVDGVLGLTANSNTAL
jgi:hypothetical protein